MKTILAVIIASIAFPLISAETQVSVAPLDIHIEISASYIRENTVFRYFVQYSKCN